MAAKNFSAGWNDPPELEYVGGNAGRSSRDLFAKRVAFPLDGQSPQPNFSNGQMAAAAVAVAGQQQQQHYFDVHHANSSSSNQVHTVDHFLRSASTPNFSPLPSTGQRFPPEKNSSGKILGQQNDSKITTNPTVAVDGNVDVDDDQLISIVKLAFETCRQRFQPPTVSNVERRINALESCLKSKNLTPKCKHKLTKLIKNIEQNQFRQAYDLHSIMMVDHFTEVNSWMIGLKAIIMEHLKM